MGILAVVLAVAALIVGLAMLGLLLMLLGIHTEERRMSLTGTPPTRAGAMSRHVLGVYVRRPRADSRCRHQDVRR